VEPLAWASLGPAARAEGFFPHTLRELEEHPERLAAVPGDAPALSFDASRFRPAPDESVAAFLARVATAAVPADSWRAGSFASAAVVLPDPSESPRPELASRFPSGIRRLVDVGCGRGATGADLRARVAGLEVTGIESSAAAAAAARDRLHRVLEGDAAEVLAELAAAGERFDALLLGDVLEHTADPVAVLAAARDAAEESAVLVASVPNAGHISIVRDLVLGRFDPTPSGLLDAGHLRWFTRSFLEEALDEAGWIVESVEGLSGAPSPDGEAFRSALLDLVPDPPALDVYQWIAVARPRPRTPAA
jgi:SAM-dependent methyltransferase